MRLCQVNVITLIFAAACIGPSTTALAEPAWISPTAQYPDGFVKKMPEKQELRLIHGDGTPIVELSGLIHGLDVSLNGPGEDAKGRVDTKSDHQKISVKKGYKRVPLNWAARCYVEPPDLSCTVGRSIYGSKQEQESEFEVRGPRGPICILKDFSEPLGAKIMFDQAQLATDPSGCLSQADSAVLLGAIGEGGKTVVTFDTPDGPRSSNLAGLSAAVQVLGWLRENAILPTKEMLIDAFEQRFFACGLLGGELSVRTSNVRLTTFLDSMIIQGFGIGSPLNKFEDAKPRMQTAFLEGATKYRGQQSKTKALEGAYQECMGPSTSRYLYGWGLSYP